MAIAVSTALEDISVVGAALDSVHDLVAAAGPGLWVAPSHVSLCAQLLHVPPGQAVPVRSDVGDISGFDLSAFNRFRQAALADATRLRDVKHAALSEAAELITLEVRQRRRRRTLMCDAILSLLAADRALCGRIPPRRRQPPRARAICRSCQLWRCLWWPMVRTYRVFWGLNQCA